MKLVRLNKADGSWDALEAQWRDECVSLEEDYGTYAEAALSTLRDECDDGKIDPTSGVFGLKDENGKLHSACFLNTTPLKGYIGPVLRIRHTLLSPYYDFSDLSIDVYASVLAEYFMAIIAVSDNELKSQNIKLHYRSPYDRQIFAAVGITLRSTGVFQTVASKGMWLHLTKK